MNAINHSELNRPVHLARRDAFFERAVKLLSSQREAQGTELQIEDYEEILLMLRISRQHAYFSIRNIGGNENDEQFSRFINLLAGNVKAVLTMINLKGMVENAQGSSFGFLGVNQASAGLQAEEYHRRACDIVRSMQSTLMLASEPFENLKRENRETAGAEENLRYAKARGHFERLAEEKHAVRRIPSMIRRFMRA